MRVSLRVPVQGALHTNPVRFGCCYSRPARKGNYRSRRVAGASCASRRIPSGCQADRNSQAATGRQARPTAWLPARLDRLAPGREICAAHCRQRRPHDDIGVAKLVGADRLAHDGECLQQDLDRSIGGVAAGFVGDVHGNHQFGAHRPGIPHGNRGHQTAVHELPGTDAHRLKDRRHRTRCTHRRARVAAAKQDAFAAAQVGRHNAQGHRETLHRPLIDLLIDITGQRVTTQDTAPEQGQGPVGEHGLLHVGGDLLHLSAGFSTGVDGGHQAAGRRTYDHVRFDAGLLQDLDHPDMGEPRAAPPPSTKATRGGLATAPGGAGTTGAVAGGRWRGRVTHPANTPATTPARTMLAATPIRHGHQLPACRKIDCE